MYLNFGKAFENLGQSLTDREKQKKIDAAMAMERQDKEFSKQMQLKQFLLEQASQQDAQAKGKEESAFKLYGTMSPGDNLTNEQGMALSPYGLASGTMGSENIGGFSSMPGGQDSGESAMQSKANPSEFLLHPDFMKSQTVQQNKSLDAERLAQQANMEASRKDEATRIANEHEYQQGMLKVEQQKANAMGMGPRKEDQSLKDAQNFMQERLHALGNLPDPMEMKRITDVWDALPEFATPGATMQQIIMKATQKVLEAKPTAPDPFAGKMGPQQSAAPGMLDRFKAWMAQTPSSEESRVRNQVR